VITSPSRGWRIQASGDRQFAVSDGTAVGLVKNADEQHVPPGRGAWSILSASLFSGVSTGYE